ncbi:MAG: carboxypeptidase-like regulatory domain-containing protein [Gemmataceae bacterium]
MKTPLHSPALMTMAFLGLAFVPSRALAHRLGADCTIRGKNIQVEAFFGDNSPAKNAHISVVDGNKTSVAEGRTDDKGAWSFPAPVPGIYRVIVDAGYGHRAEIRIDVPQTKDSSPAAHEEGVCCNDADSGDRAESVRISEGASRDEITHFPWWRIGCGLTLIAGTSFIYLAVRRAWKAHNATIAKLDPLA